MAAELQDSLTILDDLNNLNDRLEQTDDMDMLAFLLEAPLPAGTFSEADAGALCSQQETLLEQPPSSQTVPGTASEKAQQTAVTLQVMMTCKKH